MLLSSLASVAAGSNAGAAAKTERSESYWPQRNELLAEPAFDDEEAMSFRCHDVCVPQTPYTCKNYFEGCCFSVGTGKRSHRQADTPKNWGWARGTMLLTTYIRTQYVARREGLLS